MGDILYAGILAVLLVGVIAFSLKFTYTHNGSIFTKKDGG